MRLTSREKEIIGILKKEPLIAQEDLARRLGIARSSIAVHISNLMKKGVILGRGYVFNEKVSGVVFGESHVETRITAGPHQPGFCPAHIETRFSGFGFRVSCCLTRFGMDVKLLSIMGVDGEGDRLLAYLKQQNIDTAYIHRQPEGRTARTVRLLEGENESYYRDALPPKVFLQLLEAREWLAFNCEWLVVQPLFQEMVARKQASRDNEKRPALCTVFRANSSGKPLPEYLAEFYLVVLGVEREDQIEDWAKEGRDLLERGLHMLVITDGISRVWVGTRESSMELTLGPNQGFSINEGLEYFLAGIVYGLSQGYQFRQAIRIGSGMASFTEVNSA